MKNTIRALMTSLAASALATTVLADGLNPGSALVYPVQYTGGVNGTPVGASANGIGGFSVICITNTNLDPIGGSTNVHFEYVNIVEQKGEVVHCNVMDRVENLTPADNLCVLARCHNADIDNAGYLVVSAQDPEVFDQAWAFDHLVGSEVVVDFSGGFFTLNAIPFKSLQAEESATDVDGDGQLDFDGVEYEGIPEELYLDSFVAAINQSLVLINLTGGPKHKAFVAFDIFNDNEFALSATVSFQCWMQRCLGEEQASVPEAANAVGVAQTCISPVFSHSFLFFNTPNDPAELDTNCDGIGDFETGWTRIRGLNASSSAESLSNPALLGATIGGVYGFGGRRLWESKAKQLNGDFLNTGSVAVD